MSTTISGSTGIDRFGNTVIAGHQIGYDEFYDGEVATGTPFFPNDDTIPQVTEGTQFYSLTYTPKAIGSKLVINSLINAGLSVDSPIMLGIFKSDVNDALGFSSLQPRSTGLSLVVCTASFVTTSLDPITFTIRVGSNIASTVTINGLGGIRKFGGAFRSGLSVTEIAQ